MSAATTAGPLADVFAPGRPGRGSTADREHQRAVSKRMVHNCQGLFVDGCQEIGSKHVARFAVGDHDALLIMMIRSA